MIRALVFDFDGLILETESPIFASWQELYRDHQCELSIDDWAQIVGTLYATFDPQRNLEDQIGRSLSDEILEARRQRERDLVLDQQILPGVLDYLQGARQRGLKLAVASSSPADWVLGHLERLDLLHYFDSVKTGDQVQNTKPDPELYLKAAEALQVHPSEALAFEDSPNGMLAAQRAGMRCVLVPNELTHQFKADGADLELASLSAMPLEDLLRYFEA